MADPSKAPDDVLETAQYAGATIYLSAYVRRMARAIGVVGDEFKDEDINAMVMAIVEPLNLATEVCWRALMEDLEGQEDALQRFRESLNRVVPIADGSPPELPGREVKISELKKGDVVLFSPTMERTVEYCVPSDIDPVYLLSFEDSTDQIAKGPDDLVRIR